MRNILICSLCLALAPLSATAQENPPAQEKQMTHSDLATDILIYLAATESSLRACQDEESIKKTIPQFKRLKEESDRLMAIQRQLPDPSRQDCIDVEKKGVAFVKLWKAIRKHIERLENEKLITQELRDILYIAPPSPQKSPTTK